MYAYNPRCVTHVFMSMVCVYSWTTCTMYFIHIQYHICIYMQGPNSRFANRKSRCYHKIISGVNQRVSSKTAWELRRSNEIKIYFQDLRVQLVSSKGFCLLARLIMLKTFGMGIIISWFLIIISPICVSDLCRNGHCEINQRV